MHPFQVVIQDVADPDLGPLLTQLASAGYPNPVVEPVSPTDSVLEVTGESRSAEGDLPSRWRQVRRLSDVSYRWPDHAESYEPYIVYGAETVREGTVQIALGQTVRDGYWGRDRRYLIAFLTAGNPQTPLVEFLETDDFEATGEYLAVIRGLDGGRKMFGPTDSLPDIYRSAFRTEMYKERIGAKGSWNKVAVIAHKDDYETMLNHALVQARRRGDV